MINPNIIKSTSVEPSGPLSVFTHCNSSSQLSSGFLLLPHNSPDYLLSSQVTMLLVSPGCRGVSLQTTDNNPTEYSARGSYAICFQIPRASHERECAMRLGTLVCFNQKPRNYTTFNKRHVNTQNVDLPPILQKKKKKPYPVPFKQIQEQARKDKKLAQMGIEKHLEPPKNGLLVPNLVSVAYKVIDDWKLLIKGLEQLLHVVPVFACSECGAVHVASAGHDIRDCTGPTNSQRRGSHSWVKGTINDVLIPVDSYHMYDPFGRRIKHETRFDYERIPAIVELCIQAGIEIPEYPCRRRTQPVRMMGKRVIERGGYVKEPSKPCSLTASSLSELDTFGACERYPPPRPEEISKISQETMNAYEKVRLGVTKLMRKFTVKACGYCSEVHVGPWGHSVKLCGEFKHQWRDGKHGWQDALVDELFPPNYVWHVRDLKGDPLTGNLTRFYGKAPAVVEICMHSGAQVPKFYKAMMRLDIVVPDSQEADIVA